MLFCGMLSGMKSQWQDDVWSRIRLVQPGIRLLLPKRAERLGNHFQQTKKVPDVLAFINHLAFS